MVSYNSPRLSSLFVILFPLFSDWVIWNHLSSSSQILFSAWPSLLVMRLLMAFFIPFTLFCSNRISVWFLFLWFLSLLNFSLCSCRFFPEFIELSFCVFLQLTELPQDNYFEFFLGKLQIPFSLGLVTGTLLCSFGSILSPWFFSCSFRSCVVVFLCEEAVTSSILYQLWGENNFCPPS